MRRARLLGIRPPPDRRAGEIVHTLSSDAGDRAASGGGRRDSRCQPRHRLTPTRRKKTTPKVLTGAQNKNAISRQKAGGVGITVLLASILRGAAHLLLSAVTLELRLGAIISAVCCAGETVVANSLNDPAHIGSGVKICRFPYCLKMTHKITQNDTQILSTKYNKYICNHG